MIIGTGEPVAVATVEAIQRGDVPALRRLLADHPGLATARLGKGGGTDGGKDGGTDGAADGVTRSLLHVATDWPGHFPHGVAVVAALVEAGADVNARFTGPHSETPLHWAASSDDVEVLDALLDAGADIEADGGVIGNGTPLADAAAFAQWNAARRLLERGARANLWQAASLGLADRVESFFDADSPPSLEDVTVALWCACHGGQQVTAEYLLDKGGDLNWIGFDQLTPLDAARRGDAHDLAAWLVERGARTADEPRSHKG